MGRRGLRTTSIAIAVVVAASAGCSESRGDDEGTKATTRPTATTTTSAPVEAAVDFSGPKVAIVAHRGASGLAPEHTFAAYDLALEQGADYLEQDVQLSADGQLVVLHDPSLDRTARGPAAQCSGFVSDHTVEDLAACDAGTWFNEANPDLADPAFAKEKIPTLQQVFDRYGAAARYYIEVKAPDDQPEMVPALLDLLEGAEDGGAGQELADPELPPIVIQSFSADSLRAIHEQRPDLPLVQLIRDGEPVPDGKALDGIAEYAVAIGPPKTMVTPMLVAEANDRCLDVHPYTVNEPAEMDAVLDDGVGALFTNLPGELAEVLGDRPAAEPLCAARSTGR